MDDIGVVGISWRQRHADLLASFTIAREDRAERLPQLAAEIGAPELVYLATCNRVEVTFAGDGHTPFTEYRRRVFRALAHREPAAGEAEQVLRVWGGEGAAEHLFLVAAGLESARMGESEVTGQLREALDQSRALGLVDARLEPTFVEALRVAKRVRPMTEGRIGRVSLAEIGLRRIHERLERTPGAVALIGISPMTSHCARDLAAAGTPLVLVNRTPERAAALAVETGAAVRSLEEFRRAPDAVEALVIATAATEPVLGRGDLERIAARTPSGESPLVVDFAVTPNVAPEDAAAADVPRVGMEEIVEEASLDRERLLVEFSEARAIVDEALTEYRRGAAERVVGPIIAELRRRYRHTAMEGVGRLFQKELRGLGEQEREIITSWAETLARRFAHLPSVGLRELAYQMGPSAVEAFFAASEPLLLQQMWESASTPDGAEPVVRAKAAER